MENLSYLQTEYARNKDIESYDIEARENEPPATGIPVPEPAEWVMDRECPRCENGGMLVRDKFGIFCIVAGCGWKE